MKIIRTTRKIIDSQDHFGTALGYLLLPSIPEDIDEGYLLDTLCESATSLGMDKAIVLLELSPRPGGDCIPFLLRCCRNLDILKLTLDFSRGYPILINQPSDSTSFLGLRLHARRGGKLKKLDVSRLKENPLVKEIYLIRQPGDQIVMPPDDYDSWLLGHVIIALTPDTDMKTQCYGFLELVDTEIE